MPSQCKKSERHCRLQSTVVCLVSELRGSLVWSLDPLIDNRHKLYRWSRTHTSITSTELRGAEQQHGGNPPSDADFFYSRKLDGNGVGVRRRRSRHRSSSKSHSSSASGSHSGFSLTQARRSLRARLVLTTATMKSVSTAGPSLSSIASELPRSSAPRRR